MDFLAEHMELVIAAGSVVAAVIYIKTRGKHYNRENNLTQRRIKLKKYQESVNKRVKGGLFM